MINPSGPPDPAAIADLDDLARAFTRLRRRCADRGQVQLSVRDMAKRTGRPASTLDPYLRGKRLCPADIYEDMLRALGIANEHMGPWLDAWERVAEAAKTRTAPRDHRRPDAAAVGSQSATLPADIRLNLLDRQEHIVYSVAGARRRTGRIAIVTGDLRRVKCADVWVNSENTDMRMSRFEEYSISAAIRYGGAIRDEAGRVIEDRIAEELASKIDGRRPVMAGTAIVTSAGDLLRSNDVRYIVHVAAVYGEPGDGYRPVADMTRCVINALSLAEQLGTAESPVRTILFPILGTGVARGDKESTIRTILAAALDHLTARRPINIRTIYVLASTSAELGICRAVFDAAPQLAHNTSRHPRKL